MRSLVPFFRVLPVLAATSLSPSHQAFTGRPIMATSFASLHLAGDDPTEAVITQPIRRILRSAPLTRAERQFLYDLQRRPERMAAYLRVVELAGRCRDAADGLALSEAARAHVLSCSMARPMSGRGPSDGRLVRTFSTETEANGAADLVQLQVAEERGSVRMSVDTLIDTMLAQEVATRQVIDAAHCQSRALARRGA